MKGIQPTGKKAERDKQGNIIYQIKVKEIAIGYKLIGLGEPLIMIMGLGNTMERWPDEFIKALSKKYQLILMDNRGIGYSTDNNKTFTYEMLANDVISLMDALKIRKANIFGVSMGGGITQELLLKYPERFNKAIICAASIDGSRVATVIKDKTPTNPIVQRQLEATINWKISLDKLSLITNQVMLAVGTSDNIVGIESSKTLASAIPGAWLVQFKNASHNLIDEASTELVKIIIAFLDINQSININE